MSRIIAIIQRVFNSARQNLTYAGENEPIGKASLIRSERNAQDYGDAERPTDHYPPCIPLLEELRSLGQDKEVLALVDPRDRLDDEREDLQDKLDDVKVSYDATQAGGQNPAEVAKVRQEYEETLNRFNHLTVQLQAMDAAMDKNEKIAAFSSHIRALGGSDQEALREVSRSRQFWCPVKVLLMQLAFLLPLLSWNLVALWHYGVILVVVTVAGYLVYFFQKKLFSHEKLIERRIAKGCCLNCGKRLPHGDAACSSCGFVQQEPCSSCSGTTYKFAKHCRCCGVERSAG